MDFHERVGTMVFTPTDRYSIGAPNKENKEFQRKGENISDISKRDTVELSGSPQIEIPSENYSDYTKTTGMPGNCLSDDYGYKMRGEIKATVLAYSYGEMDDDEIIQFFMDTCKDMRSHQVQVGHTTGMNAKDNAQIIKDLYELFQKSNVESMTYACFLAGREIADTQGGAEKDNWVYYDSEYYEKSRYLRSMLQAAANELSSEWNAEFVDFEKTEKESEYTVDGGLDFNSVWDWYANQRGICSLSENGWAAEEHFTFFYQANKYNIYDGTLESQAGVCIITFGNLKWILDVPFNGSTVLGKLEDHFNARELFMRNEEYNIPTLLDYLGKFNVYTRFYGHNKAVRGE